MKNNKMSFTVPFILSIFITTIAIIYGYSVGASYSIEEIAFTYGLIAIIVVIISVLISGYVGLIKDFFAYDIKGKILLLVIFIGYVLRAFYQMSLSK